MTGIHDVFPPDGNDSNDPISEKKLVREEGRYSTRKTLLGFDFDGTTKNDVAGGRKTGDTAYNLKRVD
jgi:hypothetical protein